MIAPLRRRHRVMVAALFVVTAALFVWAMVGRRDVPHMAQPPGATRTVP